MCIGESKKTHGNIEKMRAFTVVLANREFIKEADYFGIATGYNVPDKFARTGMKAAKSAHVNAPIIEGFPLVSRGRGATAGSRLERPQRPKKVGLIPGAIELPGNQLAPVKSLPP